MPQGPLVYRQRLLTRITHWVWAVALFFLMLTGLQIFNAHPSLHIGKEAGFAYDNAILEIGAREVELTYLREGAIQSSLVTPALNEASGRYYIGIMFNQLDVKKPMEQIKSHAMLIVRLLKALITPSESKAAAGAVGGPVAILSMFWLYVQSSFIMALWFTCLLNVNLAVLNLLPIPVLDGGHIMLSLWEGITRRAVSYKVVSFVWNATAVLLLAVFALLTWRDVQRFIGVRKSAPPVEAEAVLETNAPAVTE